MEPKDKPGQPAIPLVENITATEVFADEVSSMSVGNGIVTLTLASVRWDNSTLPPQQKRVVVGRVRLPLAALERLLKEGRQFLEIASAANVPPASADEKKRMQ